MQSQAVVGDTPLPTLSSLHTEELSTVFYTESEASQNRRRSWGARAAFSLGALCASALPMHIAEAGSVHDGLPAKPDSTTVFKLEAGRTAVVNLAVTDVIGPGYFQFITNDTYPGKTANLTVDHAGQTISNLGLVEANPDGTVGIYSYAGGHEIADVQGYMNSGAFDNTSDERILDTRVNGRNALPQGTLTPVYGRPNSTGVVSITATEVKVPGYVQAMPCSDTSRIGQTSNLNTDKIGQTVAGLSFIKFDENGCAMLYNQGSTHIVADIQGYMSNVAFEDVADSRLVDTRQGGKAKPTAGSYILIRGKKDTTSIINIAVTESDGPGYVQIVPKSGVVGGSSNLNVDGVGRTVSGLAFARFDENGEALLYMMNGGHLVVDLLGNMADGAFEDVEDFRAEDTRVPTVYSGGGDDQYVTLMSHNNGDYVKPDDIEFSCELEITSATDRYPETYTQKANFDIRGLVPDLYPNDLDNKGDSFDFVYTSTRNGMIYQRGISQSAFMRNGQGVLVAHGGQLVGSREEGALFSGILDITKTTDQTRGMPESAQGHAIYRVEDMPCVPVYIR